MDRKRLSSISILIPTLNAGRVLKKCLSSLAKQDYPKRKLEIIIADGGSTDNTLGIISKFQIPDSRFQIKVSPNPLKTGEAGKAVALRQARGELVALIDSDNILPDKNWLRRMVEPFKDPEIIGSEPWSFTYRQKDGFIDRYCALLGMNDPLCHFLGNYDRLNALTGKWTGLPVEQEDKGGWLKVTLKPEALPTIGANGTLMRRDILIKSGLVNDYLVDIDILAGLAAKKPIKFAKVKTGIVHLYSGSDLKKFAIKQRRRLRDMLAHRSLQDIFILQRYGGRQYRWDRGSPFSFSGSIIRFILSCLLIFPLVIQSFRGYLQKRDWVWFLHPLICWVTLIVYGWATLESFFSRQEMSRKDWRQ